MELFSASRAATCRPAASLLPARIVLDKPMQEVAPLIERLDAHALVEAVGAGALGTMEQAGDAIGRDARRAGVDRVGRAGRHDRQDRNTGPQLGGVLLNGSHDRRRQRRGR
ncbi:hypothetical protein CCNA_03991 [Caulobacter vibrioides NA1000]|uniref:Uncharacterized protein n=1 Tax=Caulobacter vibrioides (strain NA1000 / CB15N) TaxID=565050 RepID=A0A0H3IZL5_CAUVN|nr:hypothetical protein [Caulobacter vibrioides]YP_009020563.1 hypothetical protein CCNA_03991 [Caulobacter vibrioides NA1000]AHI88594.1 hypothetical protein CCNA_03991 [Caulobacter vibrioides NA1000]